jgi:hypothetical protein
LLTLLRQARLMEDFLAPYEDFLRRADRDEWLRLGGYWAAVHRVLLHWWSSHPDWLQVSYESLCLTPRETFAQLASDSGLDWSAQVLDDSMTGNAEDHGDSGEIRRNTPGMPSVWRDRLSPEQSDAVLAAVRELGLDYEDGVVSAASAP